MAYILAIAGSPAHPSRTYTLLEYASEILQPEGFKTDIISVRDLPAEDLVFGRYDITYTNLIAELSPTAVNQGFLDWLNAEISLRTPQRNSQNSTAPI